MGKSSLPVILWETQREEAKSNCACSVATPTISNAHSKKSGSDKWQQAAQVQKSKLSQEQTLVFNPTGVVNPVVLNQSAQDILESFTQPQPLDCAASQQLAEIGLLVREGTIQSVPDQQSSKLTAWLHVTNACNLRCVYCYVNKTDEAMDAETGQAAIDAIFRSAIKQGFKQVELKYAGGEATLNFKLVQDLHIYAKELAEQAGLGLEAVVLSNGIALTKGMLDFIHKENMYLMISLDGSEEEHNQQRVFSNGQGSYTQVARSVDRALTCGVKPHLSITITGRSVDGIANAVAFALERDLLFNLNFYRDQDAHKNHAELRAEDERLIAAMRAAFAEIEASLPRQSLIGALVDRSNFVGPHQRSCGAGHNYLVVDHKGGIARCQMGLENPVTDSTAADPLGNIQLYADGFQNIAVDEKEGCRDCQWRYWCAGGCSLLTHRVTGRSDVKSPYCNVYKAVYPEMLRLEGLRLLKWQDQILQ